MWTARSSYGRDGMTEGVVKMDLKVKLMRAAVSAAMLVALVECLLVGAKWS